MSTREYHVALQARGTLALPTELGSATTWTTPVRRCASWSGTTA